MESVLLDFRLDGRILERVDNEAADIGQTRPDLVRNIVRKKLRWSHFPRPKGSERWEALGAKAAPKERQKVAVPELLLSHFDMLCSMAGIPNQRSSMMNHLVLEWMGCSPLSGDFKRFDALSKYRRQVDEEAVTMPMKAVTVKLAAPVVDILRVEAGVYGGQARMVRQLFEQRAGWSEVSFVKGEVGAVYEPVWDADYEMMSMCLRVTSRIDEFWEEICGRCGGVDKNFVLSHLILDSVGLSPMATDYVFQPG